jgi:hypothetical protein
MRYVTFALIALGGGFALWFTVFVVTFTLVVHLTGR